jgi:hypothetical protein
MASGGGDAVFYDPPLVLRSVPWGIEYHSG